MTLTAPVPAARLTDVVSLYAAAVRHALDDLPSEQVDDLTDGLEADLLEELTDRAAHHDPAADETSADVDPLRIFGPADAYAAELRSAAGLGPRVDDALARRGLRAAWKESVRHAREQVDDLRVAPGWSGFFALLGDLRPVWWLARAWVASAVVCGMAGDFGLLPTEPAGLLFLAVACVLSVQWGRGRWLPRARLLRRTLRVGEVIAAVLVVPVLLVAVAGAGPRTVYYASASEQSDGVYVAGRQASNLYVYDAKGALVPYAQVFDDVGNPVDIRPSDMIDDQGYDDDSPGDDQGIDVALGHADTEWWLIPAAGESGQQLWNVYPLKGARPGDLDSNDYPSAATASAPPAPFDRAGAVVAPVASPTPTSTPTPAPTSSPAVSPSTHAGATG